MKLPPASAKRSKIFRLSSLEAPHPQSSPKVMVPRTSSDTLTPLRPNSLYRMPVCTLAQGWPRSHPSEARTVARECGGWSVRLRAVLVDETVADRVQGG